MHELRVAGTPRSKCGIHPPQDPGRPSIVFLHEGLGSARQWKEFPARLSALTGCGFLAYSRWGYGGSDARPRPWPADFLEAEAATVLPALLEATGITRPVLFGHSDGATIALMYAAALPGRREGRHLGSRARHAGGHQPPGDHRRARPVPPRRSAGAVALAARRPRRGHRPWVDRELAPAGAPGLGHPAEAAHDPLSCSGDPGPRTTTSGRSTRLTPSRRTSADPPRRSSSTTAGTFRTGRSRGKCSRPRRASSGEPRDGGRRTSRGPPGIRDSGFGIRRIDGSVGIRRPIRACQPDAVLPFWLLASDYSLLYFCILSLGGSHMRQWPGTRLLGWFAVASGGGGCSGSVRFGADTGALDQRRTSSSSRVSARCTSPPTGRASRTRSSRTAGPAGPRHRSGSGTAPRAPPRGSAAIATPAPTCAGHPTASRWPSPAGSTMSRGCWCSAWTARPPLLLGRVLGTNHPLPSTGSLLTWSPGSSRVGDCQRGSRPGRRRGRRRPDGHHPLPLQAGRLGRADAVQRQPAAPDPHGGSAEPRAPPADQRHLPQPLARLVAEGRRDPVRVEPGSRSRPRVQLRRLRRQHRPRRPCAAHQHEERRSTTPRGRPTARRSRCWPPRARSPPPRRRWRTPTCG